MSTPVDTDMNLRPPRIPGRWVLARVLPQSRAALVQLQGEGGWPGQAGLSLSNHSTARTGTIAGSVVVNASIRPPPPLAAGSRAPLHMRKPLTSSFRLAVCRLWGLFVGTYSTSAYAGLAGRQGSAGRHAAASRRSLRSSPGLRRAARALPYAAALINDVPRNSLPQRPVPLQGRPRHWGFRPAPCHAETYGA